MTLLLNRHVSNSSKKETLEREHGTCLTSYMLKDSPALISTYIHLIGKRSAKYLTQDSQIFILQKTPTILGLLKEVLMDFFFK